jgi:hypothetical protein
MSKTKKPTGAKISKSAPSKGPKNTVVLFGLDSHEQPRGAQFVGEDEALLIRMAKGMGLRMASPIALHHLAVTSKLPKGDAHATGLRAVPQIALELYEKLNALVGGETGVITPSQPKTWDEIEPGHLVIAQDSLADGWWPAVVVKRHDSTRTLILRWREYPGQGEVARPIDSVALLKND